MENRLDRTSVTPTIARQTPRTEFGAVLKDTLQNAGAVLNGALGGAISGMPMVSAAVSAVSTLANRPANTGAVANAVTGVTTVGGGAPVGGSSVASTGMSQVNVSQGNLGEMGGYLSQMRAEADRSTLIQMQMQNESRDYNTITNVLKVRHDSAKAAINNIR